MRDFRLRMESRGLQAGIRLAERRVHFARSLPGRGRAAFFFVTEPQESHGAHDADENQSAAEQPQVGSGKLQPGSDHPRKDDPNHKRQGRE